MIESSTWDSLHRLKRICIVRFYVIIIRQQLQVSQKARSTYQKMNTRHSGTLWMRRHWSSSGSWVEKCTIVRAMCDEKSWHTYPKETQRIEDKCCSKYTSVWLMTSLAFLVQLHCLSMPDLNRTYCSVRLFQTDRSITNILACETCQTVVTKKEYVPSISFQAFKKSSGSENATNPYFAFGKIQYIVIFLMNTTFWLSLSRITRAFLKDGYLLNALVSTSSETSLLRSPTNNRDQSDEEKFRIDHRASKGLTVVPFE